MKIGKAALLLALAPVAAAFVGNQHAHVGRVSTEIFAGGYLDQLSRPPSTPSQQPPSGFNPNPPSWNAGPPPAQSNMAPHQQQQSYSYNPPPQQQQPQQQPQQTSITRATSRAAIGAPTVGRGLMNGGTGGSTNLPGQYGQVDHTRPYGNCRPDWQPSERPVNGFVRPPTKVVGPLNGGTGGSTNLPGQYGQVDHTRPYGNCRPDYEQPHRNRPTNGFVRTSRVMGPLNGGTGGSSDLPDQYGQVDHTQPYGNSRPKYDPPQSRPTSGFADEQNRRNPPMNGGTSGSSRMANQWGLTDPLSPY